MPGMALSQSLQAGSFTLGSSTAGGDVVSSCAAWALADSGPVSGIYAAVELMMEENKKTLENAQKKNLMLRYEIDRLEQYQRRESVRIVGLSAEKENEEVEDKVLQHCHDIGAEVKKEEKTWLSYTVMGRTIRPAHQNRS
ncbi:hypothetical protein ACOMHN_041789 [Nucella lapillus]